DGGGGGGAMGGAVFVVPGGKLTITGGGGETGSAVTGGAGGDGGGNGSAYGSGFFVASSTLNFDIAASQTYGISGVIADLNGSGGAGAGNGVGGTGGPSGLVKEGSGTLILSAANTYTGDTLVSAGTLRITNAAALGTGTAGTTIDNGAAVEIGANNVAEAFALGVASGAMNFATLSNVGGSYTLTGAISIAENGRIISANDGGNIRTLTLDAAGGDITGAGQSLTLGGAGNVSVDRAIATGSGTLSKEGAGTVTLSGANTYTGATNVRDGTLDVTGSIASAAVQVGDGSGSAGSATLRVDGASLADTAAVTVNSDGVVSGAGEEAVGSLTLDGGLLAAGATLSAAGAKTLNGGMIAGTLSGTGATTVQNGATTVTGSILGDVTVASGGTLVLASNNAVTGKIITTGAVVEYLDGVTRTGEIELNSNSTQLKVASGTATQAGLISQDASSRPLEKIGAGTLVLSGQNTYTGLTAILEGKLIVNGSLAGTMTVGDTTMLGGNGAFNAVTVQPGGTLSPGNSIGIQNFATLTLNAGSTTVIEVDSVALTSDRIVVSGVASLNGTLNLVNFTPGTEVENSYIFLTAAGGVSGAFATVNNPFLLLTPSLTYNPNSVVLKIGRNASSFASFANTPNQSGVASAIDSTYANMNQGSAAYQTLVNQLLLATDANALRGNLHQLTGAEYAQHLQSVLWSTRAINRIVTERMECGGSARDYVRADGSAASLGASEAPISATGCFTPGEAALWMRGFGSWNSLEGDDNAPGLDETQYGILFGADYSFDGDWFVGLSGGYFNSAGSSDSWGGRSGGSADYGGMQLAAYGGFDNSVFYLRGIAAYGNYDGDGSRGISGLGNIAGRLTGDPSSDVMSFYGETGYRIAAGGIGNVTPFAGLSVADARLNGFTEKDVGGSGAALRFDGNDASSTVSILGLRLDSLIGTASGMFSPELSLAWAHEFGDTYQTLDASFAEGPPGTDFTVVGSEVARDALVVGADLNVALSDGLDLRLSYDGWFNGDYTSNAVTAKLGWDF
ncbi:MAG: autotransporter domain-containing protein, partial [Aestuariivirga sp.]|uniref:autotransporter outer membrane beta-barrel domain-containing protein n=1 Tax=Aestuariivirga sp. TaxID=2650926 RepID=UPI0038CF9F6C